MFLAEVATPVITSAMVAPLVDSVLGALPVIAVAGVSIMAAFMAFRAIPKVIKIFAK